MVYERSLDNPNIQVFRHKACQVRRAHTNECCRIGFRALRPSVVARDSEEGSQYYVLVGIYPEGSSYQLEGQFPLDSEGFQ